MLKQPFPVTTSAIPRPMSQQVYVGAPGAQIPYTSPLVISSGHGVIGQARPQVPSNRRKIPSQTLDNEVSNTVASIALEPEDTEESSALLTDHHRLAQRQKQILFGYITDGYFNYRTLFPPSTDPAISTDARAVTPDINAGISKRKWDAKVAVWRRFLHRFDEVTPHKGYANHPEWAATAVKINGATEKVSHRMELQRSKHFLSCQASSTPSNDSMSERETAMETLQRALTSIGSNQEPMPTTPLPTKVATVLNVLSFFNDCSTVGSHSPAFAPTPDF